MARTGSLRRRSSRMAVWAPHLLSLALAVFAGARAAHGQPAPAVKAQRPLGAAAAAPLLGRELLLQDADITSPQISPDGLRLGFLRVFKGTRQVWVKRTDEPFAAARAITSDPRRHVTSWLWSPDGQYVLFAWDATGVESVNVYAVKPADAAPAGQDVPAPRDVTQIKRGQATVYAAPAGVPDTLLLGISEQQPGRFDVYRVRISDGSRTLVRKNTDGVSLWMFDHVGNLRLGMRMTSSGDSQLVALVTGTARVVLTCGPRENCTPLRFHADNRRVYMTSNRGATDLTRLVLFDPETGTEQVVHGDPLGRVDLARVTFSPASREAALTWYADERLRVYVQAPSYAADYDALARQIPGRDLDLSSSAADDSRWVVTATSDVEPGAVYVFDRRTKKAMLQYRVRETLPREALASMQAIRYPSRDGLEIPAYLTLPRGAGTKNLPLVVVPHGGPWARDAWGFNGTAQLLANRGYAVLQPNYRGSLGYGKKYVDSGDRQWGAAMQDDLTAGVKHLAARGLVDPARVGIVGTSFGGYAALAGVAFASGVYHAAVAMAPPSNLVAMLDAIPPTWGPVRATFRARVGDTDTAAAKAALERQSPLLAAAQITAPVLIVQGGLDPRARRTDSDRIVVSLRDRHVPVEYIVAPDEAHGFVQTLNTDAAFAAAEAFLAKYLGGRTQPAESPATLARLKQITVDPATVILETTDPKTVTSPAPAVPLVARTSNYTSTLVANGRTAVVRVSQTIKEDTAGWIATETMTSPTGDMVDTTTLDKTSLALTRRVVRQGPTAIDLTFANNTATGTIAVNGQTNSVKVDLGGAIFGDGAGAQAVLATLPLADGYTTLFRTFNMQKQKPQLLRLRVVGHEQVTVPAGTFATWKAEVSSAEGEPGAFTFWVGRETRQVVKIATSVVAIPGATMTTELVP